jgi:hypothetical protein
LPVRLRRQNGRAATAEWIKNDAVALAAITDQIGNERDRLHGRMQREVALTRRMKTYDADVENVRPISAFAAQFRNC